MAGTFGTVFSDFFEQPWERARGLLREELEQMRLQLRNNWGAVFTTNNVINNTSITTSSISAAAGTTVEALDGTSSVGSSGYFSDAEHKHSDANRPSDGEKAALVGTDGTPSGSNKYVTNSDDRLETAAGSRFKGRAVGAGAGSVADLTGTQATAILDIFGYDSGAGGLKGLVPATVAGDASKVLSGAGWVAVGGGGGVGSVVQVNTDTTYTQGGPITVSGTISLSILAKSAIDSSLHTLCGGI